MARSAQDRRFDFIAETMEPLEDHFRKHGTNPDLDSPIWIKIANTFATEGPVLGRTDRWRKACAFFDLERRQADAKIDWVVLQGVVYLVHANY